MLILRQNHIFASTVRKQKKAQMTRRVSELAKDYNQILVNRVWKRSLRENLDVPQLACGLEKTTHTVRKIDYIIKRSTHMTPKYRQAKEVMSEIHALDYYLWWKRWLTQLCMDRGCDVYQLFEMAGLHPNALRRIIDCEYRYLSKFSLAHRIALVLGEPFLPVYSSQELQADLPEIGFSERVELPVRKNYSLSRKYSSRQNVPIRIKWLRPALPLKHGLPRQSK